MQPMCRNCGGKDKSLFQHPNNLTLNTIEAAAYLRAHPSLSHPCDLPLRDPAAAGSCCGVNSSRRRLEHDDLPSNGCFTSQHPPETQVRPLCGLSERLNNCTSNVLRNNRRVRENNYPSFLQNLNDDNSHEAQDLGSVSRNLQFPRNFHERNRQPTATIMQSGAHNVLDLTRNLPILSDTTRNPLTISVGASEDSGIAGLDSGFTNDVELVAVSNSIYDHISNNNEMVQQDDICQDLLHRNHNNSYLEPRLKRYHKHMLDTRNLSSSMPNALPQRSRLPVTNDTVVKNSHCYANRSSSTGPILNDGDTRCFHPNQQHSNFYDTSRNNFCADWQMNLSNNEDDNPLNIRNENNTDNEINLANIERAVRGHVIDAAAVEVTRHEGLSYEELRDDLSVNSAMLGSDENIGGAARLPLPPSYDSELAPAFLQHRTNVLSNDSDDPFCEERALLESFYDPEQDAAYPPGTPPHEEQEKFLVDLQSPCAELHDTNILLESLDLEYQRLMEQGSSPVWERLNEWPPAQLLHQDKDNPPSDEMPLLHSPQNNDILNNQVHCFTLIILVLAIFRYFLLYYRVKNTTPRESSHYSLLLIPFLKRLHM